MGGSLIGFFVPSCPGLTRASTSLQVTSADSALRTLSVDGRVKPGHDA
jgi:hypothetical protein